MTLLRSAILLLLCLPISALAADIVGQFIVARGGVELQSKTDGKLSTPKVGDDIHLNDTIITKDNGFAKLLLKDKSILKVSPSSQLTVSIQLVGKQDSNTTINLLRGKLRALVVEKVGVNSKYEVHTSVAVAGVRGTDFEVTSLDSTTVRCYTGHVWINNIDNSIKGGVMLGPNTYTKINPGQPPLEPLPIPPGQAGGRGNLLGDSSGKGTFDQSDIREVISAITEQTLNGVLDDSILNTRLGSRYITPLLEEPLYGDKTRGRIDQLPNVGNQVPITITIPIP